MQFLNCFLTYFVFLYQFGHSLVASNGSQRDLSFEFRGLIPSRPFSGFATVCLVPIGGTTWRVQFLLRQWDPFLIST